jgi:very-short-patch-repair endonuclease
LVAGDTADQRLACLADAQRARISRQQLQAIGLTAAMIKTRLRAGQLRRVYQGVYAVGHALQVEFGQETAALLAVGPPAVLGHRTAAALWQLAAAAPEVELLLPEPLHPANRPGIRIHRSTTLTAEDLRLHHGLPVTTPTRTLLDPDRARGITRSELEQRMLAIIRTAGLPDPERNARIGPYEVDLLWPAASLVIEVDSYQWHSGPRAFKRDRRKDAYLKDHGLDVLRVTSEMIDEPLPLVARIARRIAPA